MVVVGWGGRCARGVTKENKSKQRPKKEKKEKKKEKKKKKKKKEEKKKKKRRRRRRRKQKRFPDKAAKTSFSGNQCYVYKYLLLRSL